MEESFSIDEILSAVDEIQKKRKKKKLKLLKLIPIRKIFQKYLRIL